MAKHKITVDLDDYNVPNSIDIDLDDFEDEIMEWLKDKGLEQLDDDSYSDIRDELHYGNITKDEFIEKLDAIFKYRRK